MNSPDKNGETKKKQILKGYEQFKKAGKTEEELLNLFPDLKEPEVPQGTEYIVRIFNDLSTARSSSINGYEPICYNEIKSYCDLMQDALRPWEVQTIRAMDGAFLEELRELEKKK